MAFGFYHLLTVNRTKVAANLTGFPVLVTATSPSLRTFANGGKILNTVTQSGGAAITIPADLAFSGDSAGASKYPWEIESYDAANGILVAWVNLPSLSTAVDVVFYLLFGNAAVTTQQNTGSFSPANVWDSNYKLVLHLPSTPSLGLVDSTVNAVAVSGVNTPTASTGQIDGGAALASASTQYLNAGNSINPAELTYSGWFKATSFPFAYNSLLSRNSPSVYTVAYVKNTGKLAWVVLAGTSGVFYDGTGPKTLVTGTWYHLTFVYNSTVGLIGYVNGAVDATAGPGGVLNTTAVPLRIGSDPNTASREFNGVIDEIRISSVVRTAGWILTEYNNQNAPGNIGTPGFLTFGSEVAVSAGIPPAVLAMHSFRQRRNI